MTNHCVFQNCQIMDCTKPSLPPEEQAGLVLMPLSKAYSENMLSEVSFFRPDASVFGSEVLLDGTDAAMVINGKVSFSPKETTHLRLRGGSVGILLSGVTNAGCQIFASPSVKRYGGA
eukprot:Platyproteum_vivax@DN5532_c0_g1_i2.p1